jgi:hypothetical protein
MQRSVVAIDEGNWVYCTNVQHEPILALCRIGCPEGNFY